QAAEDGGRGMMRHGGRPNLLELALRVGDLLKWRGPFPRPASLSAASVLFRARANVGALYFLRLVGWVVPWSRLTRSFLLRPRPVQFQFNSALAKMQAHPACEVRDRRV